MSTDNPPFTAMSLGFQPGVHMAEHDLFRNVFEYNYVDPIDFMYGHVVHPELHIASRKARVFCFQDIEPNIALNEACKKYGYRQCEVRFSTESLGIAMTSLQRFTFVYRNDCNFNIEPPKLPNSLVTTWDVLKPIVAEFHANYKGDYQWCKGLCDYFPYLRVIKYGKDMNTHFGIDTFPANFMFRMWPNLNIYHRQLNDTCLHPMFPRPISKDEYLALAGWPLCDYDKELDMPHLYISPVVARFLFRQASLYLANAWGTQDYASEFDGKTGKFDGGDTKGEVRKVFNLIEYKPPYDASKEDQQLAEWK